MNSGQAISFLTQVVGEKWATSVADAYQFNNCSSNENAPNRCCDIFRLMAMDKSFNCNVRRIYNNLFYKYGQKQNLYWFHLDCNPGICPEYSITDGAGICQHTSELPYVFGTVSNYNSMDLPNCTWDNQSRIFSNEIISHWVNIATTGKPLQPWPYYDPSTRKYFHITPYQAFSAVTWNGQCSIFDQIEKEAIISMFGNKSSSYYGNINIIIIFITLFLDVYS
jgi:carboxylesterase type B